MNSDNNELSAGCVGVLECLSVLVCVCEGVGFLSGRKVVVGVCPKLESLNQGGDSGRVLGYVVVISPLQDIS